MAGSLSWSPSKHQTYPTGQQYRPQRSCGVYRLVYSESDDPPNTVSRRSTLAVLVNGTAPYAPTSAIKAVIERHRQVGLSNISVELLIRMGITESLAPRTLQALKVLDLVDDSGQPTEAFEVLRRTPSAELPDRLAQHLRVEYAPVFEIMDPTQATNEEIGDAFRDFQPHGQRERMVTLFTGLMAEAGMVQRIPRGQPGPKPKPASLKVSGTKTRPRSANGETAGPTPPPGSAAPRSNDQPSDMRRAYFDLLLKKAEASDSVDVELLDRIERLVGLDPKPTAEQGVGAS